MHESKRIRKAAQFISCQGSIASQFSKRQLWNLLLVFSFLRQAIMAAFALGAAPNMVLVVLKGVDKKQLRFKVIMSRDFPRWLFFVLQNFVMVK